MSSIRLYIHTLTGKTITLNAEVSNTIRNLKTKIQEQEDVPVTRQRLIFARTQLDDSKTLKYYNIQDESTIFLAVRINSAMQIYVKKHSGETITLLVEASDSVEEIKAKIQEIEGIPVEKQHLTFGEKKLKGSKTLDEYYIQENSCLQLTFKAISMKIFVETLTGPAIKLKVQSTDTIYSIKEKIRDKEGVLSEQQQLFYNEEQLDDKKTIAQCMIQENATLQLRLLMCNNSSIFVRTLTGKTIEIDFIESETVFEVKAKIEAVESVPIEKQCLVFAGKQLEDSKTLTEYSIQAESTLYLVARLIPYVKISIEIELSTSTAGKTIELEVSASDTVKHIKEKIKEEEGFPVDEQQLFCNGKELEDSKVLSQCKADVLQLHLSSHGDVQILAETLTGKTIKLKVKANSTIEEVKAQIEAKEGIPVDQQSLVFSGKQLDNCGTVSEYVIQEGNTLYLVISSCTNLGESLSLKNDHPRNIRITVGVNISLAVVAEGKGLTYQWWKDGASLEEGNDDFYGVTTPTLTISRASLAHSGEYQCVVENEEESITSSHFTITVTSCEQGGSLTQHPWSILSIILLIGTCLLGVYSLLIPASPIICSELPPLNNGHVTYIPDNQTLTPGTLAIYQCKEGHELRGGAIRICMRNDSDSEGVWTSQTPYCPSAGSVRAEDEGGDHKTQHHAVKSVKELYQTLSGIGNWEALCMNLGVDHGIVSDLIYSTLDVTIKKKRCLEYYCDSGDANWEEVIVAVVGPPLYNYRLARAIADKYLLHYVAVDLVGKSEL